MSQIQVKILNAPAGHDSTGHKSAAKMVKRGIARWEGRALQLIEDDYRFHSERLPTKAISHAPNLPESVQVDFGCWRVNEAGVLWPFVDGEGVTA